MSEHELRVLFISDWMTNPDDERYEIKHISELSDGYMNCIRMSRKGFTDLFISCSKELYFDECFNRRRFLLDRLQGAWTKLESAS